MVILPEDSAEPAATTSPTLKRRQSSLSDEGFKRPRLSNGESEARQGTAASPTTSTTTPLDRASERRKSGQVEERKRGQRLFGALLGTLSQSSSSTAQKRRTDIEKKQQAKLRQQAEEQDEKKKQKREALLEIRRKEQVKYDKQSVSLAHSSSITDSCAVADYSTDANTAFEHASPSKFLAYQNRAKACTLDPGARCSVGPSDLSTSTTNLGSSYRATKKG